MNLLFEVKITLEFYRHIYKMLDKMTKNLLTHLIDYALSRTKSNAYNLCGHHELLID